LSHPPAPRIVPNPRPDAIYRPGFPLNLFVTPLGVIFGLLSRLFRTLSSFIPFLPSLLSRLQLTGPATPRRSLAPRDTAARFIREFEEEYGIARLPWLDQGYAQSLDRAKRELKFLLVIILSPEHDDTSSYVRETLLAPDVVSFVGNQENNVLLWGGSVQDAEAYQVANAFRASKFPYAAVVAHAPANASSRRNFATSPSGMSIIAALAGPMPPTEFLTRIRTAITTHNAELQSIRAQRSEHEASRSIRAQQDSAYERSLALDRERTRQKKLEEEQRRQEQELARKAEQEKALAAEKLLQWRRWRASTLHAEPASDDKNAARISVRLPDGGRIVRRFDGSLPVEEIYAVVECHEHIAENCSSEEPYGFKHEYKFQLVSPMPRAVHSAKDHGFIRERIGRSANLIVETLDDEDDE
jgi:FAS-associated factor 2